MEQNHDCDACIAEMTNEEYRAGMRKVLDGIEDSSTLREIYTYARRKASSKPADYQTVPDYREMIIEMIKGVDSEKILEFIYYLINSFKEKWGV